MSRSYPPISDYGAIGDCRTLALVSRLASIDWWCQPRFDAPSLFARILDVEKGGALSIEAEGLRPAGRRYHPHSAVLETSLETGHGSLVVTDFLAVEGRDDQALGPAPFARQKLVRLVRCERGRVSFRVRCTPRPAYATVRPRLTLAGPNDARRRTLALQLRNGRRILFESTAEWGRIRDGEASVEATLAPGEELGVVVDHGEGDLAGEGVETAEARGDRLTDLDELHAWLEDTLRFWRDWTAVSTYAGRYRDLVERSAITLKLLTYHPTGAIVAAGTTSLPEDIGGERNWDYRFTWLRDATFTLYALHTLGYRAESDAFMRWLTRTCRDQPDPVVLYRVDGAVPGRERELEHLEGYRGSRPVRIGNGAAWQRQLDIYGEVLDAAYLSVRAGNRLTGEEWEILASFADYAAARWRHADTSIWEVRGGRRHFTYSKVLCWVALDRAGRLAELVGRGASEERLDRWRREARKIRRAIFDRGRREDGAFVQYFDGEALDASALLFPLIGFVKADSPAATATLKAVRATLERDGLVKRYVPDASVEGVSGGEGYFLITSYWLCDNLALRGDLDEARRRFEELSAHANDLGLFSEEVEPDGDGMLGNFPQAFTHIALISTARNLHAAAEGRMRGAVRREAPSDEPIAPPG